MPPESVEGDLDGLEDPRPGPLPRLEGPTVRGSLLQAREGALHRRVIPAVRPTAHAANDPMPGQESTVVLTGVPAPAIGMGYQAFAGLATGQGHPRGIDDRPAVDPRTHRPT